MLACPGTKSGGRAVHQAVLQLPSTWRRETTARFRWVDALPVQGSENKGREIIRAVQDMPGTLQARPARGRRLCTLSLLAPWRT
jgi:hypothetical protein